MVGVVGVGVAALSHLGLLPGLPNFEIHGAHREAPHATGSVRQDTFTTKTEMEFDVSNQLSVGAEVTAIAQGFRLRGVGSIFGILGDGEVNKLYF